MSLEQLDNLVGSVKQAFDSNLPAENLPISLDEDSIKTMFSQSLVLGVNGTVEAIKGSETWKASVSYLQEAISDLPNDATNNQQIAARFFNLVEVLFPTFISQVVKSNKKKTHVQGVVTKLIQEIRNASAD